MGLIISGEQKLTVEEIEANGITKEQEKHTIHWLRRVGGVEGGDPAHTC